MHSPLGRVLFVLVILSALGCSQVATRPTMSPAARPDAAASGTGPSTSVVPDWTRTAWATVPLTDVRTGETFRLADLAGRVVFVETMAVWCVNCGTQQQAAVEALSSLDRSKVTWVALDVDPSESAEMLAAYADDRGFDFTYSLAGTDLSRALSDAFGSIVLSPPSTPVIVIGTDGQVTMTELGHKDPDRLVELATAHGA